MKGVNILPRKSSRNIARAKRHLRIRRHISGTATCPRLNVYPFFEQHLRTSNR